MFLGAALSDRATSCSSSSPRGGEELVVRTGCIDHVVNIAVSSACWFPDKAIKAGDFVVLYSKSSTIKDRSLSYGRTVDFFCWGESRPLWHQPNIAAVLAHAPAWDIPGGRAAGASAAAVALPDHDELWRPTLDRPAA